MAACPGYAPEVVEVGAERIVGSGLSCRHLRPQRDPRRPGAFISACTHPDPGVSGIRLLGQSVATTYSNGARLRRVLDT
jgi:hypothetical protein